MVIEPSAEALFAELASKAGELSALVARLFGSPPASLSGDDKVLWACLRRLLRDELQLFNWLFTILATPGTTAAEPLMRSLLDGYANVAWIVEGIGGAQGRSRQTRALCFELGAAAQRVTEVDRMEKELGPGRLSSAAAGAAEFVQTQGGGQVALEQTQRAADLPGQVAERHRLVAKRHARSGCTCRGRSYNTSGILAKMTASEPFLFATWLELSGGSHLFRGAAQADDLEAVPPSVRPMRAMYIWRGALLGVAVHALAESARLLRKVEVPSDDGGLSAWARSFRALPAYKRVMAGALDEMEARKDSGPTI